MKNLYSKDDFLKIIEQHKNYNNDQINEGVFQFLGGLFNKVASYVKKVKGGLDIQKIYDKYLKIIQDEFKKQAQVDLNLNAETQLQSQKAKESGKPVEQKTNQQNNQQQNNQQQNNQQQNNQQQNNQQQNNQQQNNQQQNNQQQNNQQQNNQNNANESVRVRIKNTIYEANEADIINSANNNSNNKNNNESENQKNSKMTLDALKNKQKALQTILNSYQSKALKEMDGVLQQLGGKEKNPKLAVIIDNKKDEFKLAFLNAQIEVYEQGGDKNAAQNLAAQRDQVAKELDAKWKNLDKVTTVDLDVKIAGNDAKLTIGKPYRYKKDDGSFSVIEIKNKSDENGKIVAAYRSGENAGKEQTFRLDNIDIKFEPKVGTTYSYFSKDANKQINVIVDNYDGGSKLAEVHLENTPDKKFKVSGGALVDIEQKTEQSTTEQSTTEQSK